MSRASKLQLTGEPLGSEEPAPLLSLESLSDSDLAKQLDYANFGLPRKSRGYEKFPQKLQGVLHFMKLAADAKEAKKQSDCLTPVRNGSSSPDESQSAETHPSQPFTDKQVMFAHRKSQLQMQKAKRTLLKQAKVDASSRNQHLSKLGQSDYVSASIEFHQQELQKKVRMSLVNMYQKRDSFANSPDQSIDLESRSRSVVEQSTSPPYDQSLFSKVSVKAVRRYGSIPATTSSQQQPIRSNAAIRGERSTLLPPLAAGSSLATPSVDQSRLVSQHAIVGDRLSSLSTCKRALRKQLKVVSQRTNEGHFREANQFVDNYFLRPRRQSRFVEQSLKLCEALKQERQKEHFSQLGQRRSVQLNQNLQSQLGQSEYRTIQDDDSLVSKSQIIKEIPLKNGGFIRQSHERQRSIDVGRPTDKLLPYESFTSKDPPHYFFEKSKKMLKHSKNSFAQANDTDFKNTSLAGTDAQSDLRITVDSNALQSMHLKAIQTMQKQPYRRATGGIIVGTHQRQAIGPKHFDFNAMVAGGPNLTTSQPGEPPSQLDLAQQAPSAALLLNSVSQEQPISIYGEIDQTRSNAQPLAGCDSPLMRPAPGSQDPLQRQSNSRSKSPMSVVMRQSLRHRQKVIQIMYQSGSSLRNLRQVGFERESNERSLLKGQQMTLKEKAPLAAIGLSGDRQRQGGKSYYQTGSQIKLISSPQRTAGQQKQVSKDQSTETKHHLHLGKDKKPIRVANLDMRKQRSLDQNSEVETDTVFGGAAYHQGLVIVQQKSSLNIHEQNPYSMSSTLNDKKSQRLGSSKKVGSSESGDFVEKSLAETVLLEREHSHKTMTEFGGGYLSHQAARQDSINSVHWRHVSGDYGEAQVSRNQRAGDTKHSIESGEANVSRAEASLLEQGDVPEKSSHHSSAPSNKEIEGTDVGVEVQFQQMSEKLMDIMSQSIDDSLENASHSFINSRDAAEQTVEHSLQSRKRHPIRMKQGRRQQQFGDSYHDSNSVRRIAQANQEDSSEVRRATEPSQVVLNSQEFQVQLEENAAAHDTDPYDQQQLQSNSAVPGQAKTQLNSREGVRAVINLKNQSPPTPMTEQSQRGGAITLDKVSSVAARPQSDEGYEIDPSAELPERAYVQAQAHEQTQETHQIDFETAASRRSRAQQVHTTTDETCTQGIIQVANIYQHQLGTHNSHVYLLNGSDPELINLARVQTEQHLLETEEAMAVHALENIANADYAHTTSLFGQTDQHLQEIGSRDTEHLTDVNLEVVGNSTSLEKKSPPQVKQDSSGGGSALKKVKITIRKSIDHTPQSPMVGGDEGREGSDEDADEMLVAQQDSGSPRQHDESQISEPMLLNAVLSTPLLKNLSRVTLSQHSPQDIVLLNTRSPKSKKTSSPKKQKTKAGKGPAENQFEIKNGENQGAVAMPMIIQQVPPGKKVQRARKVSLHMKVADYAAAADESAGERREREVSTLQGKGFLTADIRGVTMRLSKFESSFGMARSGSKDMSLQADAQDILNSSLENATAQVTAYDHQDTVHKQARMPFGKRFMIQKSKKSSQRHESNDQKQKQSGLDSSVDTQFDKAHASASLGGKTEAGQRQTSAEIELAATGFKAIQEKQIVAVIGERPCSKESQKKRSLHLDMTGTKFKHSGSAANTEAEIHDTQVSPYQGGTDKQSEPTDLSEHRETLRKPYSSAVGSTLKKNPSEADRDLTQVAGHRQLAKNESTPYQQSILKQYDSQTNADDLGQTQPQAPYRLSKNDSHLVSKADLVDTGEAAQSKGGGDSLGGGDKSTQKFESQTSSMALLRNAQSLTDIVGERQVQRQRRILLEKNGKLRVQKEVLKESEGAHSSAQLIQSEDENINLYQCNDQLSALEEGGGTMQLDSVAAHLHDSDEPGDLLKTADFRPQVQQPLAQGTTQQHEQTQLFQQPSEDRIHIYSKYEDTGAIVVKPIAINSNGRGDRDETTGRDSQGELSPIRPKKAKDNPFKHVSSRPSSITTIEEQQQKSFVRMHATMKQTPPRVTEIFTTSMNDTSLCLRHQKLTNENHQQPVRLPDQQQHSSLVQPSKHSLRQQSIKAVQQMRSNQRKRGF